MNRPNYRSTERNYTQPEIRWRTAGELWPLGNGLNYGEVVRQAVRTANCGHTPRHTSPNGFHEVPAVGDVEYRERRQDPGTKVEVGLVTSGLTT